MTIGDTFRYNTDVEGWTICEINSIAASGLVRAITSAGNICNIAFTKLDSVNPSFGGWVSTVNRSLLTPKGLELLARVYQNKAKRTNCPVCYTEAELKTFNSFSYYYCPMCKEDIAALSPTSEAKPLSQESQQAALNRIHKISKWPHT